VTLGIEQIANDEMFFESETWDPSLEDHKMDGFTALSIITGGIACTADGHPISRDAAR
jgi:hypothetical protein